MKRYLSLFPFILLLCIGIGSEALFGQNQRFAKPGMGAGKFNYQTFTKVVRDTSAETLAGNKGYENDPEIGLLFKEAPCSDCYEAIGKRTEISKTYIRKGTRVKELLRQTASGPMHYKDESGGLHTIKTLLVPNTYDPYSYTALEQPTPVSVQTAFGYSSLGKSGINIKFNSDLQLLYEKPGGETISLGNANWSNNSAGDDGVYVTDAWPGIDIEMHTFRGAIETNFWIKQAMPEYSNGKLLIRDHLAMDSGLSLTGYDAKKYSGILGIKNTAGRNVYWISQATAFELNNGRNTLRNLEYYIGDNNTLDIALPGDFLNRAPEAYPVIIDPLVTDSTSVTVPGSTYSAAWTTGCATVNPATVPPDITITDIQFSFDFVTSGGAVLDNGSVDFYLGSCRNPAASGYYWYCPMATTGNCGGYDISLYSDFSSCVPPEQCDSYNLDITMNFYQNYAYATPCTGTYMYADQPYTITVVGQALNAHPIASAGGTTTICAGGSVVLTDTATFGKPPYTYRWYPGSYTGSTVTVSPTVTTTYTLVVTDSCGYTDSVTKTITVNPNPPITGPTSYCVGTSGTLSNSISGGTWTSSTTSVATIGSSTGVLSAVGSGTSVISYTNPAGCVSVITITVVAAPSPISGAFSVCTGATTTLTDAVPGGTWSSSSTGVATIGSSSGVVTGVAAGSAIITYFFSAGCEVTTSINVYTSPVITDTSSISPSTCITSDGSITLYGLTPGAPYSVNYLFNGTSVTIYITANSSGQVVITGLAAGTYTNISVTTAGTGCISNIIAGPIVLSMPPPPSAPTATNSSPVCAGSTVNFTATCTTPGVTYQWGGPASFTSTLQNPSISGATAANAGIYTVTATILGCVSTPGGTSVIINPIPGISSFNFTNPTTCFGTDGTIILTGLLVSVSYTVNYTFNGSLITIAITSDASGNVTITGLTSGTYSDIYVSSLGCVSNSVGPAVLKDPGAPPVPNATSNSPVCIGSTLALYASDSVPITSWSWTGPNGFTSSQQNPVIYNVPATAAGTYIVSASNGACNTQGTTTVVLNPAATLINVTPDQSILFGASVQLNAWGAEFYMWMPNDGSLNNPNINNPIATPHITTTYIVSGMNEWGCSDTASVTIKVIVGDTALVPSAFTPNGDGLNDIFRIINPKNRKLVEFNVFNRWGQVVYHNEWNITQGWDGTFNGVPQDMGVYNYIVILSSPDGGDVVYKGDVMLVRQLHKTFGKRYNF